MDAVEAYREPSRTARLGVGAAIVVVIAVAIVTVGFAMWRGATAPVEIVPRDDPVPAQGEAPEPVAAEDGELYVHVFGAVRSPGLYVLPAGTRVVDAIAAAGGLAQDAATQGVNLARPLADGEQLGVPTAEEFLAAPMPEAPGAADAAAGGSGGPVNVNTAGQAALETLPGVGPALAGRIIAWREEHGAFTSVEELIDVSGIGPKVLDGLRDQVTV